MNDAPLPDPLHARLTVVRAEHDLDDVARRLAAVLVGRAAGALDLRPTALVTADTVRAEAGKIAADKHETRRAARDQAVAQRAGLGARRTHLLERSAWCEETAGTARALNVALADADAAVETARVEAEAAGHRRDRVAEQRAAALAAVEEARLELESLDGAALDETGVRRELESAGRAAQEAAAALEVAEAEFRSLEHQLATLDDARTELLAQRDQAVAGAEEASDLAAAEHDIRTALSHYDTVAARSLPDPGATALLDALQRVDADLVRLRGTLPEPPTDEQLAAAEAEVVAARRALDAVRTTSSAFDGPPPAWWVELNELHAEVVDAETAVMAAGLRKAGARRRHEEALAAERAKLDELGFASHLDALMSGGRLPSERTQGDQAVAAASTRLSMAERAVQTLRADLVAGAPVIERIGEREGLLEVATGLLGCDPGDHVAELLADHLAVPPTVIAELAGGLRAIGVDPTGIGVATAARHWLAGRDAARTPVRLVDIEHRLSTIAEDRQRVALALGPAQAVAERAATAATAAARTVHSLETELRARAGDDARLFQRAEAARDLRDQVEALEARLAGAEAEALEHWAAATEALSAAEAGRERVEQDLADLARRATRAAAELPPERRPAFDLLSGLVALGAALKAEANVVGVALELADAAVADADQACGGGPDQPAAVDLAAAVHALVDSAPDGVPLVLCEPFDHDVLAGEGVEHLLECLLDATAGRPAVVVTRELAVVGWAIGLPATAGALLTARSLDALLVGV